MTDSPYDLLAHLRQPRSETFTHDPRRPVPAPIPLPVKPRIHLGDEFSIENGYRINDKPSVIMSDDRVADEQWVSKEQFLRVMTDQQRQIDALERRLREYADDNQALHKLIEKQMQQPTVAGTFPPFADIERMTVQVFHSPDLTAKRKMGGHSEWSLKVECTANGRRLSGIDIALRNRDRFLNLMREKNTPTDIQQIADEQMVDGRLGGMIRRKSVPSVPRSYVNDQLVFLSGHERGMEEVEVVILVGDDGTRVSGFRPTNGDKDGRAKWFATWSRVNQ